MLGITLRLRGVTALHAGTIVVDGRAIVLVGDAGAGKSTTAAAFARLGYPILAEDIAALDDRGNCFWIQPGYPHVNLWPPSVELLFGAADHVAAHLPAAPNLGQTLSGLDHTAAWLPG